MTAASPQISQLASGLRVASLRMAEAHSVQVGIWVAAGARDERAGEQGIAHMLEHMAFKGTERRNAAEIAAAVENVGGYMNAHTAREETAYYIRVLPEQLELAVDVLADILTASTLPDHELERERGVIIQEIGQTLDAPDDLVFEKFSEIAFPDHVMGQSILGTVDSVSGFGRADLQGWMGRCYGLDRMLVCAAGQIDHARLVQMVGEKLAGLPAAKMDSRQKPGFAPGRSVAERDLEQSHILFGLQAPSVLDAGRFSLLLLSSLYGGGMSSRLFQRVREERGLCYSIFSFTQLYSDSGLFGVYAGTAPQQMDELLEVAAASLAELTAAVGSDELARAKAQLKAAVLMGRDSVAGMTDSLARQILLFGGPQSAEELIGQIEAVSAADISAMARRLLSGPGPALSVVGPKHSLMGNDQLARLLAA